MKKQQDSRDNLTAEAAEKLRKLEQKFGTKPDLAYKSRVPAPLQAYWDSILTDEEYVYEDICSPLKAGSQGWTTTCQYKIHRKSGNSGLKIDTFNIKDGKLVK